MNMRKDAIDPHPSAADLDRLRAGLLDPEPAVRERLSAHVRTCPVCQERVGLWPHLIEQLEGASAERGLVGRLAVRRERALRGERTQTRRRAPFAFALAAAVAAAAIGLGIFFFNDDDMAPADPVAATNSPDLYADIDFYLWLMEKQESQDASPNG
ncbi:MAG: hypothetical protein ACJ8J7_12170 [Sulfurifustaceae bacterium]